MSPDRKYIGLVLAGGESKRMGTDKALMHYYNDPQYAHVYNLLLLCCQKAYVSTREYRFPNHYPQLIDQFLVGGPINGILTALKNFPGYSIITAPCDMPDLTVSLIKDLISQHNPEALASCYTFDNQPEPLITIWNTQSFQYLFTQVKDGNYSPKSFLKNHDIHFISSSKPLLNINTPEERKHYQVTS